MFSLKENTPVPDLPTSEGYQKMKNNEKNLFIMTHVTMLAQGVLPRKLVFTGLLGKFSGQQLNFHILAC